MAVSICSSRCHGGSACVWCLGGVGQPRVGVNDVAWDGCSSVYWCGEEGACSVGCAARRGPSSAASQLHPHLKHPRPPLSIKCQYGPSGCLSRYRRRLRRRRQQQSPRHSSSLKLQQRCHRRRHYACMITLIYHQSIIRAKHAEKLSSDGVRTV